MRFASLGSGSEGNSFLVEAGCGAGSGRTSVTRLLLDCGFGLKETERRLARLGCEPDDLSAVLVTHEHTDHIGSAYGFCARHGIPLYMSHGTHQAIAASIGARPGQAQARVLRGGRRLHHRRPADPALRRAPRRP